MFAQGYDSAFAKAMDAEGSDGSCPFHPYDAITMLLRLGVLSWPFCLPIFQCVFVVHIVADTSAASQKEAWRMVVQEYLVRE